MLAGLFGTLSLMGAVLPDRPAPHNATDLRPPAALHRRADDRRTRRRQARRGVESAHVRSLIERLRNEEVFAYVTLDRESQGDHAHQLRVFANDGLLVAGYTLWRFVFRRRQLLTQ